MKSTKINWQNKLNSYLCPSLLGAVVCFTIIYTMYKEMVWLFSIIFFAAEILLFSLFDILKSKKTIGGLAYIGMLFLVFFISIRILFLGSVSNDMSYLSWFYADEGSSSGQILYLLATFIGGGFFIVSILYYFTQVRYRSLGVMLSILFPFVIYAKRAEEIPEILVTLIITLYIAVMVHNRRIDPAIPELKRGKLKINRAYVVGVALFVSVTGAVTMLIDKPEYRSQLEKNSDYFNAIQTNSIGSGDYQDFSTSSSNRYGANNYSNNPIFYFYTNGSSDIYYLRRQSYDYFDGDVWKSLDESKTKMSYYSSDNPEFMYDDILSAVKSLYADGYDINSTAFDDFELNFANGNVYDESFNPIYLPAPFATVLDTDSAEEIANSNTAPLKFTHGEIYRNLKVSGKENGIDEKFTFIEQNQDLYDYAAQLNLTGDEYETMLSDAYNKTGSEVYYNALNDYEDAVTSTDIQNYDSPKIKALAEEITKNCESDFDKAYALEQYFERNNYVYDLDYVPNDTSIEYFIFDGKTGSCSSYATAMTLMACSIGLPARYVEGFAAFEPDENGGFVVRDSQAHAFVEVYIAGVGWLTFDPTVSDYRKLESNQFDTGTFFKILGKLLVVIAVIFAVIFLLLLDRIIELIFRIKLHFKTPTEQTLLLYANLIKVVNFSSQGDYSSYTVKMLRNYLRETRGTVPEKLLELFEKTCFGEYKPDAEEFKSAYKEYKSCYKYLRKIPKQKK